MTMQVLTRNPKLFDTYIAHTGREKSSLEYKVEDPGLALMIREIGV